MKIAWHWHLHQPPTQKPEVILAINDSCYRPLLCMLTANESFKVTLSISRSLLEWWSSLGAEDIIGSLKNLVDRGQVELVGTGAYHPILTLIPKEEVIRQIKLEEDGLVDLNLLPSKQKPRGFFSPEMSISSKLLDTLSDLGYSWVLADEVASRAGHFLQIPECKTTVIIRDRGASLAVAFGHTQTLASFENMVAHYGRFQNQLVLVMDGETFGHHWPGSISFLKDLAARPNLTFCTVSEVMADHVLEKVSTISESSWGTTDYDLQHGNLYPKWKLPGSEIHELQWELTELAIKAAKEVGRPGARDRFGNDLIKLASPGSLRIAPDQPSFLSGVPARLILDQALHSDQYWWGSHNPYWNLEMVERGAKMLLDSIKMATAEKQVFNKAEELYTRIVSRGKELYGEKVVIG